MLRVLDLEWAHMHVCVCVCAIKSINFESYFLKKQVKNLFESKVTFKM